MGIIKGKDIIDSSIGNEKLRDVYTVHGDLTQTFIMIEFADLNCRFYLTQLQGSNNYVTASLQAISGLSTVSVNRRTKFDTNSYEGTAQQDLILKDNNSTVIDNPVYIESNDVSQVELVQGEKWYHIKYFISNGGTNARVRVTKQY